MGTTRHFFIAAAVRKSRGELAPSYDWWLRFFVAADDWL